MRLAATRQILSACRPQDDAGMEKAGSPTPSARSPKYESRNSGIASVSRPRLLHLVERSYWLAEAALAAAVVGAVPFVVALLKRLRRGKNGVTSNGILSRAEVMATGAVFTISALSSQGLIFTRPPNGSAAI